MRDGHPWALVKAEKDLGKEAKKYTQKKKNKKCALPPASDL